MYLVDNYWWSCLVLLTTTTLTRSAPPAGAVANRETYNVQNNDKSYNFGYQAKDHFHHADATRDNVVRGEFGSRNPATGVVDQVSYTAGPRGFRPRGKNIARKYDLSQVGPRPVGSKDDPYFDPNEDPSYNFGFRTRTYNREEGANRLGDVTGRYSFVDDIGERHNVEYIAGKNTGFHVRTPFPDSNPSSIGPLFYKGPGKPGEKPRGRTSIQRGLDGSYKFVSAGPDQRRTESSDATGHVRGSYTFIDDKGVQHSVHYIAGPETGYRVLKNVKAPHFPSWYPLEPSRPSRPVLPNLPPGGPRPSFGPPVPPDFGGEDYGDGDKNIEDIFGGPQEQLSTAASGHAKPPKPGFSGEKDEKPFDNDFGGSFDDTVGGRPTTGRPPFGGSSTSRPPLGPTFGGGVSKPSFLDEDLDGGFLPRPTTTRRPFGGGVSRPGGSRPGPFLDEEDGFGGRPGGTKPPFGPPGKPFGDGDFFSKPEKPSKPFGGDDSGGFGGSGATDEDFMEDLFKPTPGGGSDVKPPKGRPSSTRPPFEDSSGGGSSGGDDFELFGDKGTTTRPGGGGRPTFVGGSKEDMNYGFFDGHKGPTSRPGARPGGGKEDGFDFFGEKPGGPTSRPTTRPFGRPSKEDGFDFFDEDPSKRPTKRPPGKDDYDFFGTDKGSTPRPFRPTPSGTKPDDDYSFDRPSGGRPTFTRPGEREEDKVEASTAGPTINVQTSYDGKFTILTNIGDKHISFPPGVAVRAHVQSIDFLPYGSRIPSPSEQLKSESANEILPQKREAPRFLIQETDDSLSSSTESTEPPERPINND